MDVRRTTRASQTMSPPHLHCPHHFRFAVLFVSSFLTQTTRFGSDDDVDDDDVAMINY